MRETGPRRGDGSDVALEVDRGTAGYTTPLVRQPEAGDPFMAHTSPVYIACGAGEHPADREALEHIKTLIDRARTYVGNRAASSAGTDVLHHHGGNHREYLIRPFGQARTAIGHRLLNADE